MTLKKYVQEIQKNIGFDQASFDLKWGGGTVRIFNRLYMLRHSFVKLLIVMSRHHLLHLLGLQFEVSRDYFCSGVRLEGLEAEDCA